MVKARDVCTVLDSKMPKHIIITDSVERFSTLQGLGEQEEYSMEQVLDGEGLFAPQPEEDPMPPKTFEDLAPFIDLLPPLEHDILMMYYQWGLTQMVIGPLLGIRTQAGISYRIKRAIERIEYLRCRPQVDWVAYERDLSPLFTKRQRLIGRRVYETTCQTAVASELGITQAAARHGFFSLTRQLRRLSLASEKFEPYAVAFEDLALGRNWNKLREIDLFASSRPVAEIIGLEQREQRFEGRSKPLLFPTRPSGPAKRCKAQNTPKKAKKT